jgi:two-component system, response regulator, stage 0 sporulation protein F
VIVVDDDSAVREMIVRVLEDSGYQAFSAMNGRAALQILGGNAIDVAVIDLGMPGEDGWMALKSMRRLRPSLRAIIITAWPHQQTAAHAAGASACFEKPLNFPEVLAAIAQAASESPAAAASDAC